MKKSDKTVRYGKRRYLNRKIGAAAFWLLYAFSVCGVSVLCAETPEVRREEPKKEYTAAAGDALTTADSERPHDEEPKTEITAVGEEASAPTASVENAEMPTFTGYSTVTLEQNRQSTILSLEEYVVGALLAEMPSAFCTEALKAQAVACRTYAVYQIRHARRHESTAALCDRAAHCQAYVNPDTVGKERYEAAKNAADETRGLILCNDGEPILAVYHASSGAKTRSSAEVWGGERPYLVSVSSGESENPTLAASCVRVCEVTREAFAATLRTLCPSLAAYTDGELLENIALERTESGRVSTLNIVGSVIDGAAFARAFSLRTNDFTVASGDSVVITTYGYGHGVGLSQLGAEDMAQKGADFQAILLHYYPNTVFGRIVG